MKRLTKQKIYIGVAILMGLVLLVSMLPIIYCSFFDYASGDDFNLSDLTHLALVNKEGVGAFITGSYTKVKDFYLWWGGNWVAAIMWTLQPSVFGESVYHITFYVSMLFLLGGSGYFLRKVLARFVTRSKLFFALVFILFCFELLQYMPVGRTTFFWYPVVANYVFPYGLFLIAVVFLYQLTEKTADFKRMAPKTTVLKTLACAIIMVFIGGTGYMTLVLMLDTIALYWIYVVVCRIIDKKQAGDSEQTGSPEQTRIPEQTRSPEQTDAQQGKRLVGLTVSTVFFLASTIFNVIAPGNFARGGEKMDFGLLNLIGVVAKSILRGITNTGTYLMYSRFLLVFVPLLVLFTWEFLDVSVGAGISATAGTSAETDKDMGTAGSQKFKFRYPAIVVAILFLMYCSTFAPMVLMQDITASSGHTNTYWFAFMTMLTLSVIYVTGWFKLRIVAKYGEPSNSNSNSSSNSNSKANLPQLCERILQIGCALLVIATIILGKHFIGNMFAYTCYQFIDYGYLADYETQMQERFELLNDKDVTDVVLPYMNSEQGPYLFFPATDDPESYSNQVVARFYGKNSVVGMPRGEYYELYGQQ